MKYSNLAFLSIITWSWIGSIAVGGDKQGQVDLSIPNGLEVVDKSRIAKVVELSAKVSGLQAKLSTDRDVVWVRVFVDENESKMTSLQAVHWSLKELWLEDVAEMVSVLATDNAKAQIQSARGSWYYQPVAFKLVMDGSTNGEMEAQSGKSGMSNQNPLNVLVDATAIRLRDINYPNGQKRQSKGGTISLLSQIGEVGEITDTKVIRSSGNQSIDQAALAMAHKNRFTPVFVNGQPEGGQASYQVDFYVDRDSQRSTTKSEPFTSNSTNSDYIPTVDEFVSVEVMPKMIEEVHPIYPRLAMQAGLTGRVWIKALIGKDGRVRDAIVAKSSGSEALDVAALQVAPKNRFEPGIQGGKPVYVWVMYKVDFVLD